MKRAQAHLLEQLYAHLSSMAVTETEALPRADGYLIGESFLDRLVEGAIILKVKGKSYRAEKAKSAENHST